MNEAVESYILKHIDAEPPELARLYRHTHLSHLYPRMCSGHLQGRILKMLTEMISPKRVLELGTFTGYSALSIAEGMPEGSELTTIEIDDEMADELEELFAANPRPAKIKLITGDALEVLPALDGEWDMVFIDANKRNYCEYYNLIIDRVPAGGYILADNTLWSGKVVEDANDPQTRAICKFNDMVASDPRVEKVIIPLRDGLTLMRRL